MATGMYLQVRMLSRDLFLLKIVTIKMRPKKVGDCKKDKR